jgi:SAM-dependent methyltransferase
MVAAIRKGSPLAYQTFADTSGASKSEEKLAAIRMPERLAGKRVLDLGCNEGFFCCEAKRRGAARVVGIDCHNGFIEAAIERARKLSLEVEYFCCDVYNIPDEQFDVILFLSTLHYIKDPQALFARIHSALAPGGKLILECGVTFYGSGASLVRALRSIDDRLFPTEEYLRTVWLKDFAVRCIGPSPPQAGDPISRVVFHCQRAKPTVMFVHSSSGKTSLAGKLGGVTIATDALFSPARSSAKCFLPPAQKLYDQALADSGHSIRKAWNAVRDNPIVRSYFATRVAEAIRFSRGSPLIVVEGYVIPEIYLEVQAELKDDFLFWSTQRL